MPFRHPEKRVDEVSDHDPPAGDRTALGQRLEEQRTVAVRFAQRLTGNLHDAEEVVQDAFVRLIRAAGAFEGRSSFRTYLLAAVRNCCLDRRRRRMSKSGRLREFNPATTGFFHSLEPGTRFQGVATRVQQRESQELVRAAVDMLPERQRACMVLHDLEGLPYREVAEVLDTTTSNVGVLLFKARIGLRKLIDEGAFFDVG